MSDRPVAIWDAREDRWRSRSRERRDWLRARDFPAGQIYRVEFWAADVPFARVLCYELDNQGNRHWAPGHSREPHDHSRCHPAYAEPREVPLDELPPRELW